MDNKVHAVENEQSVKDPVDINIKTFIVLIISSIGICGWHSSIYTKNIKYFELVDIFEPILYLRNGIIDTFGNGSGLFVRFLSQKIFYTANDL